MSDPFQPSFSEIGLDYELGTELYRAFKISGKELSDPASMTKLKRVATFLSNHDNPKKVIRDVVMRGHSNINNLDYMDNLVQLYNDREEALSKLVQSNQDIKKYE